MSATYTLTLVRHGQSTWNLENRFTGWTDVGLTPQGEAEALEGGKLLKARGLTFDVPSPRCSSGPSRPSGSSWKPWNWSGSR